MKQQCATILLCESLLCQKHSCGDVYYSWQFWIGFKIVKIVLGTLIQIIFCAFWHCNLFLEHTYMHNSKSTCTAWSNSCLAKRTSSVSGYMYLPSLYNQIKSNPVNLQWIPDSHIKYFLYMTKLTTTSGQACTVKLVLGQRDVAIHIGSYM